MNRVIAGSGRKLLQWIVFLALIGGGSVFGSNGAWAEYAAISVPVGKADIEISIDALIDAPQVKPGSWNFLTYDAATYDAIGASGRSSAADLAAAPAKSDHSDEDDHESAASDGHNHAIGHDDHVARAYRTGDLKGQIVAGINTVPGDLKQLLPPGTIIHFWASWCRPCAEEIPQLEQFYRTRISKDLLLKGIRLVTISNDRAAGPAVHFIEKYGTTFPVYLDSEQLANLAIVGKRTLPATVMVGADGRFHRLSLGKLDWDFPRLPDLLEAVVTRNASGGRNVSGGIDEQD